MRGSRRYGFGWKSTALGLTLIVTGCAGAPATGGPPAAGAASIAGLEWVREISPFEVLDPDDRAYEMPFLGGFDVPRPQLVDIDADGDDDLFIQEETNRLLFFEAEPADGASGDSGLRYRYRPDRFDHLEIGEWYRFADADGDGDPDLFAEQPFSYVRLYRNVGTASAPAFEILADTLRDTRGAPIFSDRQNVPNMADIDCDGRLDLLIGRLVGTITRYEATGTIGSQAVPFEHVTDRFENIEIVADPSAEPAAPPAGPDAPGGLPGPAGTRTDDAAGTFAVRPTLHGANTMALVDIDSDGDIDLFWGDFFEPGLLFIENRGTCESPNLTSDPVSFPPADPLLTSGYNAPTFGDVDGDGEVDALVGVLGGAYNPNTTLVENLIWLDQADDGTFGVESRRFISQIDVGSESMPRLADLDGDGDLDLVIGSRIDPTDLDTSSLRWFENVASGAGPSFREMGDLNVAAGYHATPAFGDLDGDGDVDVILGTWQAELRWFENVESGQPGGAGPRFELRDSAVVALERGSNATPALGDLDGDGDLDLVVGEASGTLSYFENLGDSRAPRFDAGIDGFAGIDVGRRSVPRLVDLDGDGDLDLVVGSESDGILYFENRGDPTEPEFVEVVSPFPGSEVLPAYAAPALADLDEDGSWELLVGGRGGGVRYYQAGSGDTPPR